MRGNKRSFFDLLNAERFNGKVAYFCIFEKTNNHADERKNKIHN